MVRSDTLSPDAITKAMQQGDFYSSTGIILKKLKYDPEARKLSLEVDAEPGVNYTITFIGTPKDVSMNHTIPDPVVDERSLSHPVSCTYEDLRLGSALKVINGVKASYRLKENDLYVRTVVSCDDENISSIDDGPVQKKAWTQAVGWKKILKEKS